MIQMNLHQASSLIGATLIGKPTHFRGISIDSRKNCKGKLFVALKGEHVNGEDFAENAEANGAAAVLTSRSLDVACPQMIVDDCLQALSTLAKTWGQQCSAIKIGITGSNGKTTVKNMLQSILSQQHSCYATQGNFNNELGLPLSLCEISSSDDYAVLEMGAAQIGDIKHLVSMVDLKAATITCIAAAHIGRFGSLDNIVTGKTEIFSRLNEDDFAVLNADDEKFPQMKAASKAQNITFGKNADCIVRIEETSAFQLVIDNSTTLNVNLPVAGKHNHYNAACATALAYALSIDFKDIKNGLEIFEVPKGRLQHLGEINGCQIIDDSYNANPSSMKAAIDVLAESQGFKTLVMGDMAELGEFEKSLHKDIGAYAQKQHIDLLIAIGEHSQQVTNGFGKQGLAFTNKQAATEQLINHWPKTGTILFKASRSMRLETIIDSLRNQEFAA